MLRSTKLYMEKEKIMKDLLYKKFADVPTRPGRGGTYSYIKWQDVADRMNQVFGIQWSSEIVYQDVIGSNVVIRIRVSVLDTNTGNLFFQEGFGGAPIDDRQEAGTPFKAAYSKALKDACRKWGVGLYIEEDGDVEPEVIPFPKTPTTTPFVPVSPKQEAPMPPVAQKQEVKITTTTLPKSVPPVPPTAPPTVADTSKVTNTIPIQQVAPAVKVPNIPPAPPLPNSGVTAGLTMGGGQTTISDVQMAALQSIISIQGVKYNQLVKDAFDSKGVELPNGIPAMETLSYKDAVMVVKYGNDKFRKR